MELIGLATGLIVFGVITFARIMFGTDESRCDVFGLNFIKK